MLLNLCRLPYFTVEYSATIPVYISLLSLFVFTNFGLSTFMDPGAYPKGKLLCYHCYALLALCICTSFHKLSWFTGVYFIKV